MKATGKTYTVTELVRMIHQAAEHGITGADDGEWWYVAVVAEDIRTLATEMLLLARAEEKAGH